jgi:hypothetical protein
MSITITQIGERTDDFGVIGKRIVRRFEIAGVTNTSGQDEVYRVTFDGQYNDGSVVSFVMVQRPTGKFAMLNSNRHYQRISQVLSAFRAEIAQYKADNKAFRAA